jgi:uncharacterized integral membrane protein (TIGR00701 family)
LLVGKLKVHDARVRTWLVTIHLLGVVLWMGGLLMFSRVLGYHARELPSVRPRYSWLEGRTNGLVAIPGAVLTLVPGVCLSWIYGMAWFRQSIWLQWKLVLVGVILVIHAYLTVEQRRIARRPADAPLSRARFAALHGTLGLVLIAILALAVAKPMR